MKSDIYYYYLFDFPSSFNVDTVPLLEAYTTMATTPMRSEPNVCPVIGTRVPLLFICTCRVPDTLSSH